MRKPFPCAEIRNVIGNLAGVTCGTGHAKAKHGVKTCLKGETCSLDDETSVPQCRTRHRLTGDASGLDTLLAFGLRTVFGPLSGQSVSGRAAPAACRLGGEQGRQVKLLQGGMHPGVLPARGVAFGVAQSGMLDDIDERQPNQHQRRVAMPSIQMIAIG